MLRFSWARLRHARSARQPNPDPSGAASPNHYGRLTNRLFNDEASRNRAELEPIDNLTRSTTPHSAHVAIALGALVIALMAWLRLGSMDHSLWLTGKLLDASAASAQQDRTEVIRIETIVRPRQAEHLRGGNRIFLFGRSSTDTYVSGTIRRVHRRAARAGSDWHSATSATVQLDIEFDHPSASVPPNEGEYRLRVPVGKQRPIEMLRRLAMPRPGQKP